MPEPGPRPSTGITRLPRYNEPLRLPRRPKADHFRSPGWWSRPTTAMDLARCLKDLVRMLTPIPRLERARSRVGCSPAPNGLPLLAGGSAPARNYRGLLRVHLPFGLRTCTLVAPRTSPEAPVDDLSPQLLQWLPGEPTIPRTGLAPAGLRDPGGLRQPVLLSSRETSLRAALPGT